MSRPKLIVASSESSADILYATHFHAPDVFSYLQIDGKSYLLLSDLEVDRGRADAKVHEVHAYSEFEKVCRKKSSRSPAFAEVLVAWLRSHGIDEANVPGDFPLGLAKDLKKQGIRLKPAKDAFFPERQIKSEHEIQSLENASRIAEIGMTRGIDILRASRINKDGTLSHGRTLLTSEYLRTEIETAVLRAGGIPRGDTIVACGNQACDPHCRGTGPLRANELIILDIFPRAAQSGYFGDITRTVVRGRASDAQRHLWQTCLKGQEMAIEKMKPGMDGAKIHEEIKGFFAESGYPTEIRNGRWQGFFHGTGHGLGLEIHEAPRFGKTIFQPGQVITVEPGIYIPGIGGVRHEDVAHITPSGPKLLTQIPKPFEL